MGTRAVDRESVHRMRHDWHHAKVPSALHLPTFQLFGAGSVAIALVLLAVAAGRRRRAKGEAAGSPGKPAATVPQALAPAAAAADPASLSSVLDVESSRLWSIALGLLSEPGELAPAHAAVLAAAEGVLAQQALADRLFPRRPLLMPQLLAAVNDPDAPPSKLASIISQDPVLTGNILRLANSVVFRVSNEPVETIQRAVVVCGTDGLQSLAAAALVQPVFRGGTDAQSRFPTTVWERCMRAGVAAEVCARRWCPADRQAAQLLALLSALGPLVAFRIVQEQYAKQPALRPSAEVYLRFIARQGRALAARIAAQWQVPERLLQALEGGMDEPLVRSLRAGELMATLSLLLAFGEIAESDCEPLAVATGIDDDMYKAAWARIGRAS